MGTLHRLGVGVPVAGQLLERALRLGELFRRHRSLLGRHRSFIGSLPAVLGDLLRLGTVFRRLSRTLRVIGDALQQLRRPVVEVGLIPEIQRHAGADDLLFCQLPTLFRSQHRGCFFFFFFLSSAIIHSPIH